MGKILKFCPVKLFIGILYPEEQFLISVLDNLINLFGEIDFVSLPLSFNHTNYYESEMGKNLIRRFVSFHKLLKVEEIPGCKLISNRIEDMYAENNKRKINIDPGMLSLPNIILLSTKNFTHRIPLKNNIYGEVTLMVEKKKYIDLPWTFPDYKTPEYKEIFLVIRDIYKRQLFS